ncbi:unnamed protein product [Blepharisma stoltei]|uniref:Dynein-1, subspecies f n=1 Tax=Blepharisma stoltei TaxID=1481888 RepID=A0AAU9IBD9_9CILI|nr:unnamed protein product [Blepharisma stoltei]
MGEEAKQTQIPYDYIIARIAGLLGLKKTIDKMKKSFENEDNVRNLQLFTNPHDDLGYLVFVQGSGDNINITSTLPSPASVRKKVILMYKTVRGVPLDPRLLKEQLGFMELSKNVLENMSLMCQEVYLPVLANPQNQHGWSDLVSKDLIENKFHNFLSTIYVTIGEVKGRTMLPIPPQETTTSDRISSKDKAHVLEGAVITWTKQIKNVLKQDPETALKQGQDPNPLVEIEFWKNKAENLNSIHQQLQSEKISKVLKFLEQNKSTYTNQFSKLKKEVKAAKQEANDNSKYLKTLGGLFYDLTDDSKEFSELEALFVPIMHTILLIWNHSEYYNTPARLVVLIREICNAIVAQACRFMSGKDIFQMIANEEAGIACERLSLILDIIAKFKEAFFEYKAKANDSWNITTNALFVRLDAFSERCQDIQHLTNTIVQFSKLNKIEIGGTKGKTLTTSVKQIYSEFTQAVEEFQAVKYDIMDVGAKEFDDDFYEFRCKIKELERRLGSILTQGFDDCDTIYGRFKLLDSFEGLLTRPIIQDELEKKHITLLESYKQDLKTVQQIFLECKPLVDRLDEKAPISKNMPPVTGAINWTRGLMERIKEPMEKLSNLNQTVLEREEYKDVQKLYKSLMKSLSEYQNIKIQEWEAIVEKSCKDKLKQPLLARDENSMLKVNFDPALVKLLREVKYFLLISMPVPQSAQEIFSRKEIYRTQTGNLDMIVAMYNEIKQTLLPVEEPLLEDRIIKMDQTLEPGFNDLKWRSPNINDFIHASMIVVKDVNTTVKTMQQNLAQIKKIMGKWGEKPLIERKSKPMSPDDFDQAHKASVASRLLDITAGGRDINKLMKETGECVKNARKSIHWLVYQDYCNGIVIEGLSAVINRSLVQLAEYIDPVMIKKLDLIPMFDIKIELVDAKVVFTPEIESKNGKAMGLRDYVHSWVSDFLKITTLISRVDLNPGDYLVEIRNQMEVQFSLSKIENHMDWIDNETSKFKATFSEYSYLWSEDLNQNFEEFMKQGEQEKKTDSNSIDEDEEQQRLEKLKSHPIFEGVTMRIPELKLFDEKITQLKNIQVKISSVVSPHDIAWLRINVEPLKVALTNKVVRWTKVYTDFLLKNATGLMRNLTKFIEMVLKGIELKDPENIPKDDLMKIMSHVRDVRTIKDICDNIFVPMRENITLLKKHGVQMEGDLITKIEDQKTKWEDLKLKVNEVKAVILPHQTEETKKIKINLSAFDDRVSKFREDFLRDCPQKFEDLTDDVINNAYQTIDRLYKDLIVIDKEASGYNELNELFELEKSNYRPLKECRQEVGMLKILWDAISLVQNQYNDWKNTLWDKIDTEDLLEQNKNLERIVKALPKEVRAWVGYSRLQDTVKNMATILPLINELHSPCMEPRHWRLLMQITGKQINHTAPTFCLDDLLHLKLHAHEEDVREIVAQAQREATIEKKLNAIEAAWANCELAFETHKDCPIILPLDETIEMLETHSMELMSMQSAGKSVEFFRDRVMHWLSTMKTVESVLSVWIKVQRNWRRLETIFLASEDIRSQLPDKTKLFEGIDNDFREIMADARANCKVIEATTLEGRETTLKTLNEQIESCESALNEYLAQKKKQFPRFYFISNQALLDILSNGNNPHRVCKYLGDLFNGMRAVEFEQDPSGRLLNIAVGMYSKEESEYVPFPDKINNGKFTFEGPVETYLSELEVMMRKVLKAILEHARTTAELWDIQGEKSREIWIDDYPAQIALVGTQIVWTEETARTIEEVFVGSESAMKDFYKVCSERIYKLIDRVVQPGISKDLRTKIITIITIDVHGRDVIDKFAFNKISDTTAFAWQSQLKFEWKGANESDPNKDCMISICDWRSRYAYEYVGNCGRLVITPLTDRCYITLTQALNLIMGGAPAGPAGTGKTETVKDLGRACGLPVIVFNCSPQMNKESMGRIFMGLAQTGAWGCFDEFNRISIEVLSVVSTQVKTILDALRAKKERFQFEEEDNIALRNTVGMFITMNPGYAGRTELPENIKALFRSCAMVVPDTILICENMLMSEGFKNARLLSHKFVTLYELSRELLSKQKHYDWGLRAVKSVLRMAGKLRRADPEMDEDPVLMRALRDFNLPKIVTDDKTIFVNLIKDLFPGLDPEAKTNLVLKEQLVKVSKKAKLQPEEIFINKCIQLSEIMEVRHSVFIIGPPGCGKTEVWKMLAAVAGAETAYETVNPKAVTANELFGYLTKTKEWKDGVLSVIMRDMYKNENHYKPTHKNKWIVLDGDIDPDWIESLNTVMDDNKVLTLVSNERIPLTDAMRLIFEISHLKNATPATVSRAGVLYINDTDIGTKPYMDSWLETVDDDIARSHFMLAYQQTIEANLEEIHRYVPIVPNVDIAIIQAMCTILYVLINAKDFKDHAKNLKEEDKKTVYENFFIYAGIWAIGGPIGDDRIQAQFNSWWKHIAKKFPENGTVFDYYYDPTKLSWQPWSEKVTAYEPIGDQTFSNIIVPTVDIVRMKAVVDLNVIGRRPTMFVGGSGTGKTTVAKDYLTGLNIEEVQYFGINFNNYTDSIALYRFVDSHVEKRMGREYGPPANKQLIFFIDDLNMPFVDKYGTQSPIAFIIQLLNYNQMYDRDHLEEQKRLKDVQFMACMNPKSGSFTVDTRLQRHFTTFATYLPTNEILTQIYKSILGGHLANFDNSISKLGDKIIQATIELFKKITDNPEFSPSAKKFHYQFNLRDISRIIAGIMQSSPSLYRGSPDKFVRLWIHECDRTFIDRLITDSDNSLYLDYINNISKRFEEDIGTEIRVTPNIYTSFVSGHSSDKAYLPIKDMAQLKRVLEEKLNEYNENNAQMNLVLFDIAMEHVCRIARIIDMPAGNALLIGVGGSGKQSLSRLASFILGYDVIQILVSDKYTMNDFKTDIQEMYKKAGVKAGGTPCMFIITDTQIQDERFLIYINDMLSSGYVQDLFDRDELDAIFQSLKNEAKSAGVLVDSPDQMLQYFIDKARRNLHIVLCFSPVGDLFRKRARKFPGLISCTLVDWFHPWPREALIDVGFTFLKEVDVSSDEMRMNMANYMADVHVSVNDANQVFLQRERRNNYTTPKSFLELIDFFKSLLRIKRSALDKSIERLRTGLDILSQTQGKVENLKKDLDVKMEEVKEKQEDTAKLITQVTAAKAVADKEMADASGEEEIALALSMRANELKAQAEKELEEAKPAMERAKAAVDCLDKTSIQELKALPKPPLAVLDVTKAVLLLLKSEKKNLGWPNAQKMMANPPKFIEEIGVFDKEHIDEGILDLVRPIIVLPHFTFEEMSSKSKAASYLCAWVVNVVEYNRIYKKVKPLMDTKDKAEAEVAQKEQELSGARAKVKAATDTVEGLQQQLAAAVALSEKVEREANECKTKLELAKRLVGGLGSENTRWNENIAKFKEDMITVLGDALLASAFVSYIGPFSAWLRLNLWQETWLPNINTREISFTQGVDPLRVLCTESDEAKWKNFGLPADRMSIENAAIVTSCSRWPLIIDPQLQGSKWIRGMHGEELEVIQFSQERWVTKLESCIQLGRTVMIESIGQEIDAILEPLLARAIIKKGKSTLLIKLGAEEIEYNPSFKLYLQTKLSNPHYRPEIAAQCTIINFIVTESGLEDQLLATVVNLEKPELEKSKQDLVKRQNEFKVILADLEESLLTNLSSADPNTILSNTELIVGLEKTKVYSEDIKQQTIQAQKTEVQINEARDVYRRVAGEGAMLYFLIISLCVVDHMYQYSLESFLTFLLKAVDKTPHFEEIDQRVVSLRENIRSTIYQWVSRGLFEKHKQIFLTQITLRLMQKGVIDTPYDPQMVSFLLKCPIKANVEKPQSLDWLPDIAWFSVQKLIEIEEFQNLATNMDKDAPTRFKEWFNDLQPEVANLPLDWKRLNNTPFQKLLVLRCLRPDRLTTAVSNWIRDALPNGNSYVDIDQGCSFMDILENVLEDATNTTPIFFILSPGTDPVADVEKIGKKRGIEEGKNYWNVAMGEGTELLAMKCLEMGHKEGHWVILQNIHLMPKWLMLLEKKLDAFQSEGSNISFRLFLSAEPSDDIPIGILDRSIKLTNEPPQGMKANLKRAFAQFNKDEFNERDPRVRSIIFGLCFFHATVVERRKFGAKGWNMRYPFNMGDLRDSSLVLLNYFENSQGGTKIPWEDLRYIFGEIMYGGHIVDEWDRKLCRAYLANLMDNALLDETELFPFSDGKTASFKSPPPTDYAKYIEYIDEKFPAETPIAFGMHPNAEIGFRTAQGNFLFSTLLELAPKDEASGEDSSARTKNEIAHEVVDHILTDMNLENMKFDLDDIKSKVAEGDERICFTNVFLQECEYMNYLLFEMLRSLQEIELALKGELTPTEKMEQTIDSLVLGRVPQTWVDLAYPSCRGLPSWLINLQARVEQLSSWKDDPNSVPKVTNVARLFNPQSFLTAVKQFHARKTQSELNKLYIQTDITKRFEHEIEDPPRDGAFVTGLNLDGARWDLTNGQIEESKPKEMFCPLPVVNCKAAIVGDGREDRNTFYCPVYKTENRGNTYVFTAQLRTPKFPAAKWVLAGVAMIMDVEGLGDPVKK